MDIVNNKNVFLSLARKYIKRDGIEKFLNWICRSDFFVCPASTQYNLPVEGGLCAHSLNVFDKMCERYFGHGYADLTEEDEAKTFEDDMTIESIAIVSLFSSINKANCYKKDFKNVKVNGKWEQQEYWRWEEAFIYPGRGAKSVYIIQQYMSLWIEEAQAISMYLAGEDNIFSSVIDTTYKKHYEQSSLALFLHLAEVECTYFSDKITLES